MMSMTTAQQTALVAAINADGPLQTMVANKQYQQIADAMNVVGANPVWIPTLSSSVILSCILVGDMPTTSAQLSYLQMLLAVPSVDTTNANVRANFSSIFTGKQTLTNLIAAAQRMATRYESLFLTPQAPANTTSVYGAVVLSQDVRNALGV